MHFNILECDASLRPLKLRWSTLSGIWSSAGHLRGVFGIDQFFHPRCVRWVETATSLGCSKMLPKMLFRPSPFGKHVETLRTEEGLATSGPSGAPLREGVFFWGVTGATGGPTIRCPTTRRAVFRASRSHGPTSRLAQFERPASLSLRQLPPASSSAQPTQSRP